MIATHGRMSASFGRSAEILKPKLATKGTSRTDANAPRSRHLLVQLILYTKAIAQAIPNWTEKGANIRSTV
jgi:hypothetical protein